MLKRITLFLVTNLAILTVLGLVMSLLGRLGVGGEGLLGAYQPLLVMAAVMGFGGAFLSLLMSKWVAKWTTGAQIITSPRNREEAWLVETVERQAQRLGISTPEVAVYDSPELNAFATGPTRNNALVAVSTGLLRSLRQDELEAVIGHEVSHVANGDMVTLTLLQGVLNTFVIVASRVIGGFVDRVLLRGNDEENRGPGIGYFVTTIVAQLVLGILATLIVMAFSRYREYRADAGGAALAGREKMISALRRLSQGAESSLPQSLSAFGINSAGQGWTALFLSHPPIEQRIERLRQAQ